LIVPILRATSSHEIRSPSWEPISTATSPTSTSVSGPSSTVTLSMLTVPTSGRRRPLISTSQSFVSARRQPSP
jgi:hypothetical protein